jgi:hypothetical protein
MVNISQFCAVGDGEANDTGAFAAAFESLGAKGGIITTDAQHTYRVDSLCVPPGVTIRGELPQGDSPVDSVNMPIGQWGAIVLNEGATIRLHSASGLDSVMVRPYGMTFPQSHSTAWAGTAVTLATGCAYGAAVVNSFIVGFDTGISSINNARIVLDRVRIDANNPTRIIGSYDSSRLTGIHAWPFATHASFWASGADYPSRDKTMLYRSGTGLFLDAASDDTCVDACMFYGHLIGAQILNAGSVNIGRLWIDHPFGMKRPGNYGVFFGAGSMNAHIAALWLFGMQNGVVMAQDATDCVMIDSMIARYIDASCVSLGSGNLHVGRMRADSAAAVVSIASPASGLTVQDGIFTNLSGPNAIVVPSGCDANRIRVNASSDSPPGLQLIGPNPMGFTQISSSDPLLLPTGNAEKLTVNGTVGFGGMSAGWAGKEITLFFANSLTVFHGGASLAGLRLANNANFNTTAGSMLRLVHDGSHWIETSRKS